MSTFNKTSTRPKTLTKNQAGGKAYTQNAKSALVGILMTSFMEDKFYEKASDQLVRLKQLVAQEPEFAAKAAVYARKVFHMRTVTQVVIAEVAGLGKPFPGIRKAVEEVVQRPDDMAGIVAYYRENIDKKLPAALIKGLRKAFDKFSDYQILKYKMETRDWKMIDLINVIRPKPTERNAKALELLVKGGEGQASADTWEVAINAARALPEAERGPAETAEWDRLIREKKLGYMAMLRNIGKIETMASVEAYTMALARLEDPEEVAKSKQFPYRFYTAIKVLSGNAGRPAGDRYSSYGSRTGFDPASSKTIGTLSRALDASYANIEPLPGKTLVAIDTSGSMYSAMSERSVVQHVEVGALMGAVLGGRNGGDVMQFGDRAANITFNPMDSLSSMVSQVLVKSGEVGHATNMSSVLALAAKQGKVYDRIVYISDMQGWYDGRSIWSQGGDGDAAMAALKQYRDATDADPFVYNIDLTGGGTTKFTGDRYIQLAGFSDKVLELFRIYETGMDATVEAIEAYEV